MVKILKTVKIPNSREIWKQAIGSLEERLASIPESHVSPPPSSSLFLPQGHPVAEVGPSQIEFSVGSQVYTILMNVTVIGEPRHARNAINQLLRYRAAFPNVVCILGAPYLSAQVARLCQTDDISYIDLAGNCHLAFGTVYIHIEGKPNLFSRSGVARSLYQPKAERILRVLLTYPTRSWRLPDLAREAEVSIGQTYKVKELLLEKEWLAETEQGIVLIQPRRTLTDWTEHYAFRKHQSAQFHSLMDLTAFEQMLSHECRAWGIPCAFTSFAASARYAPYASYQRTTVYIHHTQDTVKELLTLPVFGLTNVDTGANVILLSPYDDGVFYGMQQWPDISLVSPLQAYLDLQSTGGRGREAAALLLDTEVFSHK